MTRTLLVTALTIVLVGCTVVKINKDNTTTIEHKEGAGVGQDLANQACRKTGGNIAVIVSTVNKDTALPPGTGKQVTTFRCS